MLANLDFEYELATGPTYITPKAVARVIGRWRHILRLLPGFEDARTIMAEATATEATATEAPGELLVWGVTARTAALLARPNFPSIDAVRLANDKRFSHALEVRLGISLPTSCIVASPVELERAASASAFDWVAKHPLGVSGRERILGKAGRIDEPAARWAARQFDAGWQLVFEPWVAREREYSLQFDIAPQGFVSFVGACELLTDSVGTFRGHQSLADNSICTQLVEAALPALAAVFEAGYHGPVGIDALVGRLGDEFIARPITEINARHTFGRLALALERFVPPGWQYVWWHPSPAASQKAGLEAQGAIGPHAEHPGVFRLPEFADPNNASQTFVIAGPDLAALDAWGST
ncbi:MAG: hypothetical protein H0U74_06690 [Bradymonadaceae bacterium]|nr:hypothetical protein [Lujinxingiaceae bacterium]